MLSCCSFATWPTVAHRARVRRPTAARIPSAEIAFGAGPRSLSGARGAPLTYAGVQTLYRPLGLASPAVGLLIALRDLGSKRPSETRSPGYGVHVVLLMSPLVIQPATFSGRPAVAIIRPVRGHRVGRTAQSSYRTPHLTGKFSILSFLVGAALLLPTSASASTTKTFTCSNVPQSLAVPAGQGAEHRR